MTGDLQHTSSARRIWFQLVFAFVVHTSTFLRHIQTADTDGMQTLRSFMCEILYISYTYHYSPDKTRSAGPPYTEAFTNI